MLKKKDLKLPQEYEHLGLDSWAEVHFVWWMRELLHAGIIFDYSRAATIPLCDRAEHHFQEALKTKVADRSASLFQPVVYTPDFSIVWNETHPELHRLITIHGPEQGHAQSTKHATGKLWASLIFTGTLTSTIEVKGTAFGKFNNTDGAKATLCRKWAYQRHGILVDQVNISSQNDSFFKKTFTPMRFLLTNTTKKSRSIRFEPRTLSEFLAL